MSSVGIRHHQVGLDHAAVGQLNRSGRTVFNADAVDGAAQPDVDATALHQAAQCARDRAGAAHREEHTVRALQVMNQSIDAGRVERVTTHQQGLN